MVFSKGAPAYRLYNPFVWGSHYTNRFDGRGHLASLGWNYEGIGQRSMSSEVGNYFGVVFLYYQYNPSREGQPRGDRPERRGHSLVRHRIGRRRTLLRLKLAVAIRIMIATAREESACSPFAR